jgi:1-phosphatidylinositol-4-phosphate 5-kinase
VIDAAGAAWSTEEEGGGGAGGGGGGGCGGSGGGGGGSGAAQSGLAPIFIAPGSPFSFAVQAKVPEKKRRLHRPDVVKRLAQGAEEFERRKAAKALGKTINKEHALYHVSYGMMLGIYASVTSSTVSATETLGKLQLDDLMAVRKLVFPPAGTPLTPPHHLPGTFKFKDFAPAVFHSLRERFEVDQKLYLTSLGGACEYIEFNSNSKSGSFFFYSHDGKFMIKTQSKTESKFLRRILAHYYQHVMTNPMTYVTRFFGMHRIKMPHLGRTIYFVVMQSVFHGDYPMVEMYDLKVRRAFETRAARHALAPAHPPPLPFSFPRSPNSLRRAPRWAAQRPKRSARRASGACGKTATSRRREKCLRWARSGGARFSTSSRWTPRFWNLCKSWTTRC